MILKDVVPWGRSRSEYISMFNLGESDMDLRILGCGDGPSSFNSECSGSITSVDPIYRFTAEDIKKRIDETADIITKELEKNRDDFIWSHFKDVSDLKSVRLNAMEKFLLDYPDGKKEGRYIEGALPYLQFPENSFDLVLSSHFLFLYSSQLDFDFHLESVKEMLRVGKQVRIFPLCDLSGKESEHLKGIISYLDKTGISNRVVKTGYEFQKGADCYLEIGSLSIESTPLKC